MNIEDFFPIWDELSTLEKERLTQAAIQKKIEKNKIIHNSSLDCHGLLLITSGQIRAYIISENGREITLYRLSKGDICLFSASCMIEGLDLDITLESEKETEFSVIPPEVYRELMDTSAPLSNYTNRIMATRLSDILWLIDQILWKGFDQRLAHFLIEESRLDQSEIINITHEKIAYHLGTAREVVTRMLQYFQKEGIVKLFRGKIEILHFEELQNIVDK